MTRLGLASVLVYSVQSGVIGPEARLQSVLLAASVLILTLARLLRAESFRPAPPGRRDLPVLLILLVLALFFRLHDLAVWPPGPTADEGINGKIVLDILDQKVLDGVLTSHVQGEESGTFFLQAWVYDRLGPGLGAFRLPSAIAGALMIPLAYLLMRQFCGVAASLVLCLLLAVDPVQLYFSRLGNSIIYASTMQVMVWLALCRVAREASIPNHLLAGFCLLVGLQGYPAFRLVAITSILVLTCLAIMDRGQSHGSRIVGVGQCILFLVLLNLLGEVLNLPGRFFWDPDWMWLVSTPLPGRTLLLQAAGGLFLVWLLVCLRNGTDGNPWKGLHVAVLVVLLPMSTLFSAVSFEHYVIRLQDQTILSMPWGNAVYGLMQQAQRVAGLLTGRQLPHPIVWGLQPLVLALFWFGVLTLILGSLRFLLRRHRPVTASGTDLEEPEDRLICWRQALVFLAFVLSGILSPLAVSVEAEHARRFVLLTVPVYLIASMGLHSVVSLLSDPRGEEARPGKLMLLGVAGVLLLSMYRSHGSVSQILDETPPEVKNLQAAIELGREAAILMPDSQIRYPLLPELMGYSPECQFLIRDSGIPMTMGLNPFPINTPLQPLSFILLQDSWLTLLSRYFPRGKLERWSNRKGSRRLKRYVVDAQQALKYRGLRLTILFDGDPTTHDVPGVDLQEMNLPPECEARWDGAIYVPRSGYWQFDLRGEGKLGLKVGGASGRVHPGTAFIWAYFTEGWHPLEAYQASSDRALPSCGLYWKRGSGGGLKPAPWENLLRMLPPEEALQARPAASLVNVIRKSQQRYFTWHDEEIRVTDILFSGKKIYSTSLDGKMLLRRRSNGQTDTAWRGVHWPEDLREEAAMDLPPSEVQRRSLALAADGTILVVDGFTDRMMVLDPEGLVKSVVHLASGSHALLSAGYDDQANQFLVADSKASAIHRITPEGLRLPDWKVPGVSAVAVSPGGGPIFAASPTIGAIVMLDREGHRMADWRCVELTSLTRIAADSAGQVYVLGPRGNLRGYTSQGEVFVVRETIDSSRHRIDSILPLSFSAPAPRVLRIGSDEADGYFLTTYDITPAWSERWSSIPAETLRGKGDAPSHGPFETPAPQAPQAER